MEQTYQGSTEVGSLDPTDVDLDLLDYDRHAVSFETMMNDLSNAMRLMHEGEHGHIELSQEALDVLHSVSLEGGFEKVKKVGKSVVDVKRKTEDFFKALGAILDSISMRLNAVAMTLGKLLLSGEPLVNGIIKRATTLKERAKKGIIVDSDVNVVKLKHLVLKDDRPTNKELVEGFKFLNGITKNNISTSKLTKFAELTNNVLEPFRHNVKTKRTDQLVATIGILSIVTNPVVPVGIILKKLGGAATPGIGKAVDLVTLATSINCPTTLLKGLFKTLPTLGVTGDSLIKQLNVGKLDVSILPHYGDIYPFCKDELKGKNPLMTYKRSPVLLGNAFFEVNDYSNTVQGNSKLSYNSTGARFGKLDKLKRPPVPTMEALNRNDIVVLCDYIIESLTYVKEYNKAFTSFYKTYNLLYREISDLVMSNTDQSYVGMYVRYSYRNALNLMLDSMWKNCFGSDNKYIRHLLAVSKDTLQYCEASITDPTDED